MLTQVGLDALAAVMAVAMLRQWTLLAVIPALWVANVAAARGYEYLLVGPGMVELRRILRAGIVLSIIGDAFASTAALPVARAQAIVIATTTAALTLLLRFSARLWGRHRAPAAHRVVIAGHRDSVARVAAELARTPRHGLRVAGLCLVCDDDVPDLGVPVTMGLHGLVRATVQYAADAVIVLPCRHVHTDALRRLGWELEATGTQLFVSSGLLDVAEARTSVASAGSVQMLHIRPSPLRGPRRVVKEVWERGAALLALLLLSPLLAVLAVVIRLESRGPAIYTQTRIGRRDRPFRIFKLRTMSVDADQRGHELAGLNEADGVLFKLRHDPRITRFGRLLRRYSLDELPQLANVVLGHMALVGPRPPLPNEVEQYDYDVRRKLAVKPGLTGLWQVSGRSDLSWDDSVRLDLRYVDNWSLSLDLVILARTARAVFSHAGAY